MDNNTTNNDQNKDLESSTLKEKTKDYLKSGNIFSRKPLKNSPVKGMSNLLDAMLAKGIINSEEFNSIKFEIANSSKPVETVVLERQILNSREITRLYAEMRNISFVELRELPLTLEILNKIPISVAKTSKTIPFEEKDNILKVAMKDPLDLQKIKYIESITKKKVEPYYAAEEDINYIIDTKYGAQITEEVTEAMEEFGGGKIEDLNRTYTDTDVHSGGESAPIIKIVNMILDYGVKNKASDIHIEPTEKKIRVRFRIRGILVEKLTIPRKLLPAVVTRIKILSNLKIDEHRIPQDGRFQIKTGDRSIDLRVSIMPGVYGEKVVMRLLEKTQGILNLEDLGLKGISYARVKDALKRTQGIFLVTGPTGSGKTQTLSSCLKILNVEGVNIMTLEDPVEIRIEGVNQVQVNAEVGLTFATGLRSFLRQDPDIIMVGEIRDSETASLAVQAALVGRLVLSTVHTNSAAGAFVRLIDMGVEPFLLSSTVNVSIGQRLVRTLCECKQPIDVSDEFLSDLHQELDPLGGVTIHSEEGENIFFGSNTQSLTLYKPVGCPKCNETGYSNRTGIFEVLTMSETIAKLVMKKASISEIHNVAVSEGMITMVQDGFIKVLQGITTMEEVLRVKNE